MGLLRPRHVLYAAAVLDSTGKLGIAADFEAAVFPRFDDTVALDAQGAVSKFCRHLLNGIDKTDAALIADFAAKDIAPELCAAACRVLPRPDALCDLNPSTVGHLLALVRYMVSVNEGKATQLTAANVSGFSQYHELLRLVAGPNLGAVAALGLVVEITRLALDGGGTWTTATIDQVATAIGALDWLLPTLRVDRVRKLPPSDRLKLVGKEVAEWRADRGGKRVDGTATPATGALGDADPCLVTCL